MTAIRQLNWPGRVGFGSLVGVAVWFGALAPSTRLEAQLQTTPLSYTVGQADQGQAAYLEHCVSCHGQNLDDGAYGPPLKGNDFRQKWVSRSPEALFTYTTRRFRQRGPVRPATGAVFN